MSAYLCYSVFFRHWVSRNTCWCLDLIFRCLAIVYHFSGQSIGFRTLMLLVLISLESLGSVGVSSGRLVSHQDWVILFNGGIGRFGRLRAQTTMFVVVIWTTFSYYLCQNVYVELSKASSKYHGQWDNLIWPCIAFSMVYLSKQYTFLVRTTRNFILISAWKIGNLWWTFSNN